MVKKIISERHCVVVKETRREFNLLADPESGFTFPVDDKGEVILNNKDAEANFKYCVSHPEEYEDLGTVVRSYSYTEPAHAICEKCGCEITLDGDRQCECGQWHNAFGQSLLPPEYWHDSVF